MKYCSHCDELIRKGEAYDEQSIDVATGPGITVYRHLEPCRPAVPRQTAPVGLGR
ncbi:hypothetical protein [Streptomyces cahuitamycinicus]|uniref:hypothetical protein n=1 Tax=Streptomyces cahuitamycinicus TaxID=2070367 RepID=UPI001CA5BE51|nr:hypothetical protein [Streptomyces cahuitamycinicus]